MENQFSIPSVRDLMLAWFFIYNLGVPGFSNRIYGAGTSILT